MLRNVSFNWYGLFLIDYVKITPAAIIFGKTALSLGLKIT